MYIQHRLKIVLGKTGQHIWPASTGFACTMGVQHYFSISPFLLVHEQINIKININNAFLTPVETLKCGKPSIAGVSTHVKHKNSAIRMIKHLGKSRLKL